jgi:hypothetical protein
MKSTTIKTLILAALLALPAGEILAQSHTAKVYKDTNGDREVVASGGTLKVLSGGSLVLDTGSTLTTPAGSVNTSDVLISGAAGLVFSGTTGQNYIKFTDNLADALSFQEGSNKYMTFTSTDSGELIAFKKNLVLTDGKTIVNSANTTGTSLWGASDKGAFFGATPVVVPTSTTDLRTALINLGLYTTGGASPLNLNGGAASVGALTTTGVITVDSVALNNKALTLPGRATISICGDLTTINNNTVYYGPSAVLDTLDGQHCDTTAAGNTTEATADEPGFVAQAFQVLSMDCRSIAPGATVSFTLRSAAAATTPSVTCTETTAQTDSNTNAGTTTAIASGATIAIAAASTGDIGSTKGFRCNLQVAY